MIQVDPSPEPFEWSEFCRASSVVDELMSGYVDVVLKSQSERTSDDLELLGKFDRANQDLSIATKRWQAFINSQFQAFIDSQVE